MYDYYGYSSVWAPDRILDLTLEDEIDLSLLDADSTRGGRQAARLIAGDFTGQAGEMRLALSPHAHRTHLEIDVDGDAAADFAVVMRGDQAGFTNFLT